MLWHFVNFVKCNVFVIQISPLAGGAGGGNWGNDRVDRDYLTMIVCAGVRAMICGA